MVTLCPTPTSGPCSFARTLVGGHWLPAGLQSTAACSPSSGWAKHHRLEDGRVKKQEKIISPFEHKSYRLGKRLEIQSGPNQCQPGRTSGSLGREDLTPPPASVDEPPQAGTSLLLLPLLHGLPGTGGVTPEPLDAQDWAGQAGWWPGRGFWWGQPSWLQPEPPQQGDLPWRQGTRPWGLRRQCCAYFWG